MCVYVCMYLAHIHAHTHVTARHGKGPAPLGTKGTLFGERFGARFAKPVHISNTYIQVHIQTKMYAYTYIKIHTCTYTHIYMRTRHRADLAPLGPQDT